MFQARVTELEREEEGEGSSHSLHSSAAGIVFISSVRLSPPKNKNVTVSAHSC